MTGMRKRVTIGFLSIVCLLFFSGMVSLVELSRLSRDTDDLMQTGRRTAELAKAMLDAAHSHNVAMIRLSVFGDRTYDSLCLASLERLEERLQVAQREAVEKSVLDSTAFAATDLRVLTDEYMAFGAPDPSAARDFRSDSEGARWYKDEYMAVYVRLTGSIKAYMTSTQSSLVPRTVQMKRNAYRAVTPVLISLVVMIAIVLMFFYFMTIYCVNPILGMNKGLGDWLAFRAPFAVRGDLKDEVLELKEKIETLIAFSRQNKM
ncbi:MAG: hypothetical protein NC209_05025 [Alistipes sp.]|nr:hypothetical protein [Alistipes senegalensis]MCM1250486.1 hypothetical protein [Alistipes sp.]